MGESGICHHSTPEWDKVWSRLSSHLQPFFWLIIARIFTIFDKKYRILTHRDKRESYLTTKQYLGMLKCSPWLSVTPTLAPSGSYLLSQPFTGSLWLLLDLSLSLSGSLWPSVTPILALTGSHCNSLAYSGPLRLTILSNFAYTVLDRLSGPLIGSQRRCHADALSPALYPIIIYIFRWISIYTIIRLPRHTREDAINDNQQ